LCGFTARPGDLDPRSLRFPHRKELPAMKWLHRAAPPPIGPKSAWQAIISIYPSADRRTDMILPASGWKRSRHFATLGLSQVNSINEQIKTG
jgi:hypothetical protein